MNFAWLSESSNTGVNYLFWAEQATNASKATGTQKIKR